MFASALVGREDVPYRVRRTLNIESGLNDGLALPAVLILAGVAGGDPEGWSTDPLLLVGQALLGIGLGVAIPLAVEVLLRVPGVGAVPSLQPLGPLAVALLVFGVSDLLEANQFLAAFVAGATVATLRPPASESFRHTGELISEMTKGAALLAFASLLDRHVFAEAGLLGFVLAVIVIGLCRPIPLLVALAGTATPQRERWAVAWFGPKGFASLAYAVIVAGSGMDDASTVLALTTVAVLVSVVAHSSTDVLVAERLRSPEPDSSDADAAELRRRVVDGVLDDGSSVPSWLSSWGSLRDEARTRLWPLPLLAVLAAVALGIGLPRMDAALDDRLPAALTVYLFGGGAGAARTVLTAIATSLITVTSLTFSLTVVTLQLASSQYSPRLLRTFTRDRFVHGTLALFLGSFVYALTVLRTVRTADSGGDPFVPQLSVTVAYVLMVASVVGLVMFLAHLAREIRVETILATVHAEASDTIARVLGGPDDADDRTGRPASVLPDEHASRALRHLLGGAPERGCGRPARGGRRRGRRALDRRPGGRRPRRGQPDRPGLELPVRRAV